MNPTLTVDLSHDSQVNFAFLNWLYMGEGQPHYAKLRESGTSVEDAYRSLDAAYKAGNKFTPYSHEPA